MLLLLVACQSEPPGDSAAVEPVPPATAAVVTEAPLTEDAEAAVALLPRWLQLDARLALSQIGSGDQDEIAAQVLGLDDPMLLDEVGFGIAHVSPEVLDSSKFHPEVLVENARMIYAVDPMLDYVELVEHDGDDGAWTTTRYNVYVDGEPTTMELTRDQYYWYVVHPRIEDEHPWFVDTWDECRSGTLECSKNPDEGTFWRHFLWDLAGTACPEGESCPKLVDTMPGITTYWGDPKGNDAIHAIAGFMLSSPDDARWFSFGAYDERSIQPNRIYGLGRGNCGEWADMTTALARTALIPNVNVTPSSWDHTWNAFLFDRWIAWEPVNWWFDYAYGSGYATYAANGDASVWYQTEQYNPNTFTLEIAVADAAGAPVDGATVTMWSAYGDSWWFAGELATGPDGVASVALGADLAFAYMVTSPLGDYPGGGYIDIATEGTAAGETTTVIATLGGTLDTVPVPTSVGLSPDTTTDAHLSVTTAVEGRVMPTSWRYEESWATVAAAPALTTWVMTAADYEAFLAGDTFAVAADDLADVALPSTEPWVVVLLNQGTAVTGAVGTASLELSPDAGAAFVESTTWSSDLALLPGEHVAVELTPGE